MPDCLSKDVDKKRATHFFALVRSELLRVGKFEGHVEVLGLMLPLIYVCKASCRTGLSTEKFNVVGQVDQPLHIFQFRLHGSCWVGKLESKPSGDLENMKCLKSMDNVRIARQTKLGEWYKPGTN